MKSCIKLLKSIQIKAFIHLNCNIEAILDDGAVCAEGELGRLLAEVALAADRSVLLVELGRHDVGLGLPHRRKNERLAVIVPKQLYWLLN